MDDDTKLRVFLGTLVDVFGVQAVLELLQEMTPQQPTPMMGEAQPERRLKGAEVTITPQDADGNSIGGLHNIKTIPYLPVTRQSEIHPRGWELGYKLWPDAVQFDVHPSDWFYE